MPSCVKSPFEILLPPLEDDADYVRGWRLDQDTQDTVVALARAEGICSTCDNNNAGIRRGFYVSFNGVILDNGDADRPPTVSLRGDLISSQDGDGDCPGGSARPPLFDDETEDQDGSGTDVDGFVQLMPGLLLLINDNGDDTVTFTLEYEGDAWLGLAVSPTGRMVGSQAVLGRPDATGDPVMIYDLEAKSVDQVVPADTPEILLSSSLTQANGVTTLTFTVPLDTDGYRVNSSGETGYLYAVGFDNGLSYHEHRSPFRASLGVR